MKTVERADSRKWDSSLSCYDPWRTTIMVLLAVMVSFHCSPESGKIKKWEQEKTVTCELLRNVGETSFWVIFRALESMHLIIHIDILKNVPIFFRPTSDALQMHFRPTSDALQIHFIYQQTFYLTKWCFYLIKICIMRSHLKFIWSSSEVHLKFIWSKSEVHLK